MRTELLKENVTRYGGGAENQFSIAVNAKMIRMLSDGIYSNKILAVIRELSCNAWDAHVDAGNKKPFEVHLPTILEPYFAVRDFGTGLSHKDIMNLYTTYGASTKDESDDFIGAFGIGSKSPFAYADQFTVTSTFKGTRRAYAAFIGEDGMPIIKEMAKEKTTDHNGLEVSVAVEEKDFRTFQDEASTFFKRASNLPTIHGLNKNIKPIKYMMEGTGWKLGEKGGNYYDYDDRASHAIQGNVAYQIDTNSFSHEEVSLLRCYIDLYFDIGELEVASSREALSYNDKTIKSIKKQLKVFIKEFPTKVDAKVKDAKTIWEAQAAVREIKSEYRRIDGIDKMVFKWQGTEIDGYIKIPKADLMIPSQTPDPKDPTKMLNMMSHIDQFDGESYRNQGCIKRKFDIYYQEWAIDPKDSQIFFINDLGRGMQARIRNAFEHRLFGLANNDNPNKVWILPNNPTIIAKLKTQLDGADFRNITDLDAPTKAQKTSSNPNAGTTHWKLTTYDLDPIKGTLNKVAGGYYVPILRNRVVFDKMASMSIIDFNGHLAHLKSAGGIDLTKKDIYGIPVRIVKEGLDSKWINFYDLLISEANKVVIANARLLSMNDAFDNIRIDYTNERLLSTFSQHLNFLPDGDLKDFVIDWVFAKENITTIQIVINSFGLANKIIDKKAHYRNKWSNLVSKYPMLFKDDHGVKYVKGAAEYIAAINA